MYNIYYFDVRRCSIYQETKTGSGIRYVKLERMPQITWVLVEDRSGNGIVREDKGQLTGIPEELIFFLTLSLTFTCIISRKRYSERAQTNVQKFLHTIYMYIAYTCIYICIQMHTFSFQIGKNMLYINSILYRKG